MLSVTHRLPTLAAMFLSPSAVRAGLSSLALGGCFRGTLLEGSLYAGDPGLALDGHGPRATVAA